VTVKNKYFLKIKEVGTYVLFFVFFKISPGYCLFFMNVQHPVVPCTFLYTRRPPRPNSDLHFLLLQDEHYYYQSTTVSAWQRGNT